MIAHLLIGMITSLSVHLWQFLKKRFSKEDAP